MLTNTMSSKLEHFQPINVENIRMYVCGPTVYDRAHIGNLRSAVNFDILYRLLRFTYGQNNVTYVRNYTDIDDKIISKAVAENKSMFEVSSKAIKMYESDLHSLRVLEPNYKPKVSDNITEIISFITDLINSGMAYEKNNSVYFRTKKFKDYGILSGKTDFTVISDDHEKEDGSDFALWKKDETHGTVSPWGIGRPGWHIECSAIAKKILGDVFDIHGGGGDLIFPHHENEIAQSCCLTGEIPANIWVHNNMLMIENKKMSKSLGNMLTLDQFKSNYELTDVQARYCLMRTSYKSRMNITEKDMVKFKKELDKFHDILDKDHVPTLMVSAENILHLYRNMNMSGLVNQLYRLKKDKNYKQIANILLLLDLLPEKSVDNSSYG